MSEQRKAKSYCTYKGEDIADDLKRLFDYVQNGKPESELTRRIDQAVVRGRQNSEWRTQYTKEIDRLKAAAN